MKSFLSILAAAVLASVTASAQSFTGRVTDSENLPVEFATVVLYSELDSVMVTGTVTDAEGRFSLKAEHAGNAFLKVSFIGYQTQTVPPKEGQTIVLEPETTLLGEVVVKGNRPGIQLKNGALVATVQNSVLAKAGTGNDVLKRLPSLTGGNGEFSVLGKGQAKIYINNREMRDVSELDRLSSEDIKEVEIVNNPGARYDASVKAVIRISLVSKAGDGFSFDVRSSYFQSQNTDLAKQLNLNYRRSGWDVFGTLQYNRDVSVLDSEMEQKIHADTLWAQENTQHVKSRSETLTGIAGANYEISPKHSVGMKYTLSLYPSSKSHATLNSTVLADGGFYDRWKSMDETTARNKPARRMNAYYNGSSGSLNIDFNADFYTNRERSQSHVTETSQEYDDRTVRSESNVDNRLVASRLILSYPVLGGQLSLGSEYTDTHRNDEYLTAGNIVPSSSTTIKERNNSFFAEYSLPIPSGKFGAGLRYENVRSDYFDNGVKMDGQSRRYDQWFPNVSLAFRLNPVNLQLGYTAKTQRPTYLQLSGNVFYGNRFTLQTGNPFLNPSVVHDVTLVGVWKFLQLMVGYKHEKDAIIYWAEQLEENPAISLLAYRNLKKLPNLVAFLTLSPTFGIWSPQLSGGVVKQWVSIESNNRAVRLNKPMPVASFNNSLRLPAGFLLTLDMNYQGKGNLQNVYLTRNVFILNAGVTKSFLNDQLSVALKGHDLFRRQEYGNLLYSSQMELFQLNRYDSRRMELTVRYKFNSAKSKYKGTGAGESEINRM